MLKDDETIALDSREEEHSPLRSEIALTMMCMVLLRRVPGLPRIRWVQLRCAPDEGDIGWELGAVKPELTPAQWQTARQALEPWRRKYKLARHSAATAGSGGRRRALSRPDLYERSKKI